MEAAAEICPKCGARVAPAPHTVVQEKKSTRVATVASVVFPGLGQIYNGQIGKGIGFIILGLVFLSVAIFVTRPEIGPVLYAVFLAYNIYDAYNTAKGINEGAY
jgi:TM2 domain-containing membrane protein YozV